MAGPIGAVAALAAIGALLAFGLFVKRHEKTLEARARAEFPGPLEKQ